MCMRFNVRVERPINHRNAASLQLPTLGHARGKPNSPRARAFDSLLLTFLASGLCIVTDDTALGTLETACRGRLVKTRSAGLEDWECRLPLLLPPGADI